MFLEEITKIEEYALANNIPIMEHDGIEFLLNYIKDNDIKNILEIGSAIGYSAIRMALIGEDITLTTIERDEKRYEQAIENINTFKLHDQIEIILSDAFDVELAKKYDLIFIDAAKAQYIKFFNKFKANLKKGGIIISDNLNFHGLTKQGAIIESRNVRQLVRKINNYIHFLEENKEFETEFIQIGDGIAISRRK